MLRISRLRLCVQLHRPLRHALSTVGSDLYERKTPVEHVLLRPGMYIGDVESRTAETWMYNAAANRMHKETVSYSPALLKVYRVLE